MEWLVDGEDGLGEVVAGFEIFEGAARVAEGGGIDNDGLAERELFRSDAEALGGEVVLSELKAGLVSFAFRFGLCDDEDEMAVEGRFGGHGDLNALAEAKGRGGEEHGGGQRGEGFHAGSRSDLEWGQSSIREGRAGQQETRGDATSACRNCRSILSSRDYLEGELEFFFHFQCSSGHRDGLYPIIGLPQDEFTRGAKHLAKDRDSRVYGPWRT